VDAGWLSSKLSKVVGKAERLGDADEKPRETASSYQEAVPSHEEAESQESTKSQMSRWGSRMISAAKVMSGGFCLLFSIMTLGSLLLDSHE